MRVLAIDPGNVESAYVVWDGAKIHAFDKVPNEEMRRILKRNAGSYEVDTVAIEMIASYGMPVGKEVFETCLAIGRFTEIAENARSIYGAPALTYVYRQEEKLHHCRSVKANDTTIRHALLDRFGVKGTKKSPGFFWGFKDDVWAAFAIAVVVTDRANGLQAAPVSKINPV